ncbi:MAG: YdeI/OmpD-associated family protein [Acidobacteria bacterium]|nr:YdeI/OmpD-associated family protein [Acidobacteriota bacterium]MCA1649898.1 YdeI/OmpD-associated family protein [Acidobacteriota bacterium]
MGTRDARVDGYIAKSAPFARPILSHIREVVHAGCPDVEEAMKWSFPHFMYKGMLCSMASFKQHCAFGFWKGSLLKDANTPARDAMGQFGRIRSVADLPDETRLLRLVKQAAALNDEGVKVARAPKAPRGKTVKTPDSFIAAVRTNKKALATYEAFSPSHKREYVEWVTEAKADATRKRRLETAVTWMAQGKERNWKYTPAKAAATTRTSARTTGSAR